MHEPNYESYSSDELRMVLANIDKQEWPERVEKVQVLLEERALNEPEPVVVDKSRALDVFSPQQIFISSFLGGPFAAVYQLVSNFKTLNASKAATTTLWTGLACVALLLALPYAFSVDLPSGTILPLLYSFAAYWVAENYQINKQEEAQSSEYRFSSPWRAAKVAVISLVLIIGLIAAIVILLYRFDTSELGNVNGTFNPQIELPEGNIGFYTISRKDVRKVFYQLKAVGKNKTFAAFAFYPNTRVGRSHVELQFSVENNRIGFDWVLLGEDKIRDESRFTNFAQQNGFAFKRHSENGVNYIRVEEGDLVRLMELVMSRLYYVTADQEMQLIAFNYEPWGFSLASSELNSGLYGSQ